KDHRAQKEEIAGSAGVCEGGDRNSVAECRNGDRDCCWRNRFIAGDVEKRAVLRQEANRRSIGIVGSEWRSERAEHQRDDQTRATARERFSSKPAKTAACRHHTARGLQDRCHSQKHSLAVFWNKSAETVIACTHKRVALRCETD